MDEQYNPRVKGKKAITLMSCGDGNADTCSPCLGMFRKTFALRAWT